MAEIPFHKKASVFLCWAFKITLEVAHSLRDPNVFPCRDSSDWLMCTVRSFNNDNIVNAEILLELKQCCSSLELPPCQTSKEQKNKAVAKLPVQSCSEVVFGSLCEEPSHLHDYEYVQWNCFLKPVSQSAYAAHLCTLFSVNIT